MRARTTFVNGAPRRIAIFLLACAVSACALAETRYGVLQFALHLLIDLILVLVGLGAGMRAWSWERRRQAMRYGFGVFLIVGSLALDVADTTFHIGAQVTLKLDPSKYEFCKADGVIIVPGKVLSVCDVNLRWNEFHFTEAVVYDSSDELAKPYPHYSAAWSAAARALDRKAPFTTYGFDAYSLGRHYYFLTFNYETDAAL